ncbi:MAG: CDP-diacylglycerol--serine O-phosphatidyltransferase [Candidatus Tectomicrobia bacterium]|uniref:CDP-diacylglycerol--serine O-phosphatidyltransferase n=1 Tax=Tectimicrobiota bacterium TaxID=2528274 RepID=A0A932CQX6_UNCTE|nr:CDP-diacylglycerol--serine O-phosphatidyltransferase [Candidatus Tectomicrobia bacterium]
MARKVIVRKGVYIIPSLFTSGNIFCGFYALVAAYKGAYELAALAILIAIILDGLDGKVARFANASSDFGIEYDSLADVITFGVAPAFLIYSSFLKDLDRLGLLAAFLFTACGALRLARFNLQAKDTQKTHFLGLPIPAAAGILASAVLLVGEWDGLDSRGEQVFFLVSVYLLAFLMVSNIRYRSFKQIELRKRRPFHLLVVLLLAILVIAAIPQVMLFLLFLTYALSGPVEFLLPRSDGSVRRKILKRHSTNAEL